MNSLFETFSSLTIQYTYLLSTKIVFPNEKKKQKKNRINKLKKNEIWACYIFLTREIFF